MNTDDKIRLYVPLIGAAFILVVLLIGAGIKQWCAANIVHQPRPDTEVMEPVENDAEIEKERPDIVSDIGKAVGKKVNVLLNKDDGTDEEKEG